MKINTLALVVLALVTSACERKCLSPDDRCPVVVGADYGNEPVESGAKLVVSYTASFREVRNLPFTPRRFDVDLTCYDAEDVVQAKSLGMAPFPYGDGWQVTWLSDAAGLALDVETNMYDFVDDVDNCRFTVYAVPYSKDKFTPVPMFGGKLDLELIPADGAKTATALGVCRQHEADQEDAYAFYLTHIAITIGCKMTEE